MHIRALKNEDAPYMLSWMHDEDVVKNLQANFASKTIENCLQFIENSRTDKENIHLAIASDSDEYMGTVSIKHIDYQERSAEFGIAIRREAMGKGYSWYGMESILQKAFEEYGLNCVYWCVSRDNSRAIRFYEKHNFHEVLDISTKLKERYSGMSNLIWYEVLKGDIIHERESIVGCRIIHINTVPTMGAGELSYFESIKDIPFEIKRIYYISKVPNGVERGFHAHKQLRQLLFCPYGRIRLTLENEDGRDAIELSDPSIGVLIEKPTWREMTWLQSDSVLCVAASDFYSTDDYIRDYNEFITLISKGV